MLSTWSKSQPRKHAWSCLRQQQQPQQPHRQSISRLTLRPLSRPMRIPVGIFMVAQQSLLPGLPNPTHAWERRRSRRSVRSARARGAVPAAKSLDKGAGALTAVPASPRASRSPNGRYKADHGVDGRLAAIELRLAAAAVSLGGCRLQTPAGLGLLPLPAQGAHLPVSAAVV